MPDCDILVRHPSEEERIRVQKSNLLLDDCELITTRPLSPTPSTVPRPLSPSRSTCPLSPRRIIVSPVLSPIKGPRTPPNQKRQSPNSYSDLLLDGLSCDIVTPTPSPPSSAHLVPPDFTFSDSDESDTDTDTDDDCFHSPTNANGSTLVTIGNGSTAGDGTELSTPASKSRRPSGVGTPSLRCSPHLLGPLTCGERLLVRELRRVQHDVLTREYDILSEYSRLNPDNGIRAGVATEALTTASSKGSTASESGSVLSDGRLSYTGSLSPTTSLSPTISLMPADPESASQSCSTPEPPPRKPTVNQELDNPDVARAWFSLLTEMNDVRRAKVKFRRRLDRLPRRIIYAVQKLDGIPEEREVGRWTAL